MALVLSVSHVMLLTPGRFVDDELELAEEGAELNSELTDDKPELTSGWLALALMLALTEVLTDGLTSPELEA